MKSMVSLSYLYSLGKAIYRKDWCWVTFSACYPWRPTIGSTIRVCLRPYLFQLQLTWNRIWIRFTRKVDSANHLHNRSTLRGVSGNCIKNCSISDSTSLAKLNLPWSSNEIVIAIAAEHVSTASHYLVRKLCSPTIHNSRRSKLTQEQFDAWIDK